MLVIARISPDEERAQFERLRFLVQEGHVDRVACDVHRLPADMAAIELLVRLQLTARRFGAALRLEMLIDRCGLRDVLPGET